MSFKKITKETIVTIINYSKEKCYNINHFNNLIKENESLIHEQKSYHNVLFYTKLRVLKKKL